MTRLLIAATAACVAFAAPALAGERVFQHEGVTYSYSAKIDGKATILEGTTSKGEDFRFVVKSGWVNGYAGGARVSFRQPKRLPSEAPVQVAQR